MPSALSLISGLATITMLQCVEDDCIAWFGVKCSSSSTVNMGTSRRSFLLPEGDVSKRSVVESNCLVARQDCLHGGGLLFSPQLPHLSLLIHFPGQECAPHGTLCCQWRGFHPGEPQNIVDVPPS